MMMGETVLRQLESKLRAEAKQYLNRSQSEESANIWLERKVLGFTGQDLGRLGVDSAINRIDKMCASQNRWSRSRHPAYDLNRHIELRRLLRDLLKMKSSQKKTSGSVAFQPAD